MDGLKLVNDMDILRGYGGKSLEMPLPKRMRIPQLETLRSFMFDKHYPLVKRLAGMDVGIGHAINGLLEQPGFKDMMQQRNLTHVGLVSALMVIRQLVKNGPIFTVNPALNLLLEDTGVKEDVPAKFFAPPYPVCFIEFDPAECREKSSFRTFCDGEDAICEGAMIQETLFGKLPPVSQETREILELDPGLPARIIEVGFTASPIKNNMASSSGMPVGFDVQDIFSIYIQDENESIIDILDRHFTLYAHRALTSKDIKTSSGKNFEDMFRENFSHLTKVFFYLHVEKNQQREETPEKDLVERIRNIGEKKREKLEKQLSRTYDRIIVGPDHYTPIKELMVGLGASSGVKAPHFRRGYFGFRWKGHGNAKQQELVRISHAIINQHLLKAEGKKPKPPREYEIT